jgi:hypothetical protein
MWVYLVCDLLLYLEIESVELPIRIREFEVSSIDTETGHSYRCFLVFMSPTRQTLG